MIDGKTLCSHLNVSHQQLAAWVRVGMPVVDGPDGKEYDAEAVVAWLVETGRGQRDAPPAAHEQPIARTRPDAANYFGVNLRTLANWLKEPGFPGKAGSPGPDPDGYFPLDEIAAWLEAREGETPAGDTGSYRSRREYARSERELIALERDRKRLIEAEPMERFFERTINNATAVLDQMPDRIEARLPTTLTAAVRRKIRKAAEQTVRETREALAELLEGDTDPTDDETDDE